LHFEQGQRAQRPVGIAGIAVVAGIVVVGGTAVVTVAAVLGRWDTPGEPARYGEATY